MPGVSLSVMALCADAVVAVTVVVRLKPRALIHTDSGTRMSTGSSMAKPAGTPVMPSMGAMISSTEEEEEAGVAVTRWLDGVSQQ